MKKIFLLHFLTGLLFLTGKAQVQIDRPIDLNSATPGNARVMGIKEVSAAQDAVSAEVLQSGSLIYATVTNTSAAGSAFFRYTLSVAPALTVYTTGMEIRFKATTANLSPNATGVNVSGLGDKEIKKDVSTSLAQSEIQAGQLVTIVYDGTNFQLISRTADAGGTVTSVGATSPISSTGGNTPTISIGNSAANGSAKGAASFTANDFDDNGSGNISLDYTNGQKANASQPGFLSSANWSTFNSKENALTFSTGLTRSTNTITANLSTGVAGGQSAIGGTAASNNLTLSSTTNATKGKILFGTSGYDEVNDRLGIGNAAPSYVLDVSGRSRFRHSGSTAGFWLSNNSDADRFFIGHIENTGDNFGIYSGGISNWAFYVNYAGGHTYQNSYYINYNGVAGNTGIFQNQSLGEHLEVGIGGTAAMTNNYAYVDLHGADATYPDYTFRMIHYSGGANATNEITSRGTGNLQITTEDAASILFRTSAANRMRINADGTFDYQKPSTGMASPVQIHSFTIVTGGNNDVTYNTGVSTTDWDCTCMEMSTAFDIDEGGIRGRQTWSYEASGVWQIRIRWGVHSSSPQIRDYDVKMVCFNKRWVSWNGNVRTRNVTY